MGILNDLKKILFGAKAVSKGAAKKTIDYTKERSEHILDISEDYVNDKKDLLNDKFDQIKTESKKKGNEIVDNVKEKTEAIVDNITESEAYKKTVETVGKAGDAVLDTGEKFIEKSKEFIDGPGKKVADTFKDSSLEIGETILAGGEHLLNKAKEATKNLGDKLDDTIEKAEKMAKKEEANTDKSEFADTPLDIKDSELKDKDDFFSKADKYAAGEYSENPKPRILDEKVKSEKESSQIDGFKDRDDDGNPLIDDAEVLEDLDDK